MKVVCQSCGKVASIEEAEGWLLEHWLGYRFTEKEVLKVGLCKECISCCTSPSNQRQECSANT